MKKIGIGLCVGIMMIGCVVWLLFDKMKKDIDHLSYTPIQMECISNGAYEGYIETTLIQVKVKVVVEEQHIQNIVLLEHQNGLGSEAERMITDMIEKNTDDVDCVSGATFSSQVIKSAVNQALQKGVKTNE